jgi:hypothetical protein
MDEDDFEDSQDFEYQDEYDSETGEQPDFDVKAERKAFERVSYEHPLLTSLSTGDKKRGFSKDLTSQEKFAIGVNSYLIRYKSFFTDDEIIKILDTIYKIDSPKYLNPFGYVLGYYVTQGTSKIIDKKLQDAFNIIKGESSISEPDIIRYARYWIINLL